MENARYPPVDTELVQRAITGDIDAFAALYETIYKDMYRLALYITRDKQDAEDAVAETVADAYSSIGKLRDPSSFRSWIFRILSIKCKHFFKESFENLTDPEEMPEIPDISVSIDDSAGVRELFFSLEDVDRTILSMHIFAGYKSHEIADYLQISPATVRSRQARALAKLRAAIV